MDKIIPGGMGMDEWRLPKVLLRMCSSNNEAAADRIVSFMNMTEILR